MGMKGAALATVAVTWLSVIVYLIQMKSILKLKLRDYFPLEKIGKTLAVTIVSGFACYPLMPLIHTPLLRMLTCGLVFIAVYMLLGRGFGIILNYDLQIIVSLGKDMLRSINKRK
jgi:peptidoglycan biosynthesis protein MviN/MurJ (putative lipid II flippase)